MSISKFKKVWKKQSKEEVNDGYSIQQKVF